MSNNNNQQETNHKDNAGGDEAFISFAFVIVSVVGFVMYLSTMIRIAKVVGKTVWRMTPQGQTEKRRFDDEDSISQVLADGKSFFMYVPNLLLTLMANPAQAKTGLSLLMSHPWLFRGVALPKLFRNIFRGRLIVVVLWVILFFMALYTNLSYDPLAQLGLPPDATIKDVKKKYRDITRKYHPDHNKTDAAAVIYARAKKAYKALVNKEEFEKEAAQEDFSVGVALPSFLTNRDNEFFIKIFVLAALVGGPYWLYKKFAGGDNDKLNSLVKGIITKERALIPIYADFGIPKEKKFEQKKRQGQVIKAVWAQAGLPAVDDNLLTSYPSIDEMLKRSDINKNETKAFWHQFGVQNVDTFNFIITNLKTGLEQCKELDSQDTYDYSDKVRPVPNHVFDANMWVWELAVAELEKDIAEVNMLTQNSIKQVFAVSSHHNKMRERLLWARDGKLAVRDHDFLIEGPRVGHEEAIEIIKAFRVAMAKYQKAQQAEYKKRMGIKH